MKHRLISVLSVSALLALGWSSNARADEPVALSETEAVEALEVAEDVLAGEAPAGVEPTLALRDLARALPSLQGSQQRQAKRMLARPTDSGSGESLSGPEAANSPLCNTNFCVHWTVVGPDAPDLTDASPANGVPDYVDLMLVEAATSWSVEVGSLGWRKPKSDGARGTRGNDAHKNKTDIYVANLGSKGIFGYANVDPGQGFARRQRAYLVMDDDYSLGEYDSSPPSGLTPLDFLRATLAHEFNHVLQFNYDTFQDGWLFESVATWSEEQVYPDVNDYVRSFLGAFASRPDRPLTAADNSLRLYGAAVWSHWLSSRFGTSVVRKTWENSTKTNPKDFAAAAFDKAIKGTSGSNMSKEFLRFSSETAEWRSSGRFPDASSYPDIKRQGMLTAGKKVSRKIDHTAYRVMQVKISSGQAIKAKVNIQNGTRGGIALVGRDDGAIHKKIRYTRNGGRVSVKLRNPGNFDRISLVLVNADIRIRGYNGAAGDWNYTRDDRRFKGIQVKKVG